MMLQIWVETGIIGAGLALAAALLLFRRYVTPVSPDFAWRYGFAATVALIAFVSHGAWQGWFWSATAAGIFWFVIARRLQQTHAGTT